MPRTQIDLDENLLERAAVVLGTSSKKATVNAALRHVVEDDLRRRHIDDLAAGALPDLADPAVMTAAWQ